MAIAKQEWDQAKSPDETKNAAIAFYNKQEGLSIEYINIVSPHDLEDLDDNLIRQMNLLVDIVDTKEDKYLSHERFQ